MRGDDLFHLEFYTIIHPQRKTGQELKPGPEPAGRSQCRGHGEVLFTGLLFVSVSALLFVCLFFCVCVCRHAYVCETVYRCPCSFNYILSILSHECMCMHKGACPVLLPALPSWASASEEMLTSVGLDIPW